MKIRKDFVTNSSSSSFIIAIHEECKTDEIMNMLSAKKEIIQEFLLQCNEYDCLEKPQGLEELDKEVALIEFQRQLADYLLDFTSTDKLDLWSVQCNVFSNETDSIFDLFIYEYGHILRSDHFKVFEE